MGTGSPLAARQNPDVYVFAISFVIVVAVAAVIFFIIQRLIARTRTEKWIEANKNRPTRPGDVRRVARETGLNRAERSYLQQLCKAHAAKNIAFLYRSSGELAELFAKEFARINTPDRDEAKVAVFFSLRLKLDRQNEQNRVILTTKSLNEGQIISIIDEKKMPWNVHLYKNTPTGFYVEIPKEFSNDKPKPLSDFLIDFTTEADIRYQCVVKAARYETSPNGKELLFITHSSSRGLFNGKSLKGPE